MYERKIDSYGRSGSSKSNILSLTIYNGYINSSGLSIPTKKSFQQKAHSNDTKLNEAFNEDVSQTAHLCQRPIHQPVRITLHTMPYAWSRNPKPTYSKPCIIEYRRCTARLMEITQLYQIIAKDSCRITVNICQ